MKELSFRQASLNFVSKFFRNSVLDRLVLLFCNASSASSHFCGGGTCKSSGHKKTGGFTRPRRLVIDGSSYNAAREKNHIYRSTNKSKKRLQLPFSCRGLQLQGNFVKRKTVLKLTNCGRVCKDCFFHHVMVTGDEHSVCLFI